MLTACNKYTISILKEYTIFQKHSDIHIVLVNMQDKVLVRDAFHDTYDHDNPKPYTVL